MPTYDYRCPRCHAVDERIHPAGKRLSLFCPACNVQLEWQFPCPTLHTETSLMGHLGDGFDSDYVRKLAYRRARAAGINPTGKMYVSQLADRRGHQDPEAWVPHSDFRSRVREVCRKHGHTCEGTVTVPPPEPEEDVVHKPYRPDPQMVRDDVERINNDHHGGQMKPKQKRELHDKLTKQYAGSV